MQQCEYRQAVFYKTMWVRKQGLQPLKVNLFGQNIMSLNIKDFNQWLWFGACSSCASTLKKWITMSEKQVAKAISSIWEWANSLCLFFLGGNHVLPMRFFFNDWGWVLRGYWIVHPPILLRLAEQLWLRSLLSILLRHEKDGAHGPWGLTLAKIWRGF